MRRPCCGVPVAIRGWGGVRGCWVVVRATAPGPRVRSTRCAARRSGRGGGWAGRAAARRCGGDKNTSFRGRHRVLDKLSGAKPAHLQGIVEADETYFLESFKGRRNLPRPARKQGGSAAKRGLSDEQIPVLIARDRTTATTDAVLEHANTQEVRAVLEPILDLSLNHLSEPTSPY